MNLLPSAIPDVLIVEPQVFGDARGYFFESWNKRVWSEHGIDAEFIQDNESSSRFGVLRGLHYQAFPYTQAKLVRVIRGTALDIALDIRRGSPTFGRTVAVELSGANKRQLFIPRGFAHGFVTLSEEALFAYKCDNVYMPVSERGIAFDDPELDIDWRVAPDRLILSPRDAAWPSFRDAEYLEYEGKGAGR